MTKSIWYLDHDINHYNEDIKSLAKSAGLLLVDGRNVVDRIDEVEHPPTVTLKENIVIPQLLSDDKSSELTEQLNSSKEQVTTLTELLSDAQSQLESYKAEFVSFQNNPDALRQRLNEIEPPDTNNLKVDEIKALLTDRGIEFKSDAKKDELLSLIPKE